MSSYGLHNRTIRPKMSCGVLEETKSTLRYRTTIPERALLVVAITVMPLQDHFPSFGGFSIMWILFGALAVYSLVNRSWAVARVWLHPVFLSGYVMIAVACLIEFTHPYSRVFELFRIAQMIAGAVFMSSLIRDWKALRACMYSYLAVAFVVGLMLFLTGYSDLRNAGTSDFGEAQSVRNDAFKDNPIQNSPNTLAFYVAQGAVVALAMALTARRRAKRNLYLAILLFCLIASFLPMSRGGIAILVVSCGAVMLSYGLKDMKTIALAAIALLAVLAFVPDVVFSRLKLQTHYDTGKEEARVRIYKAAFEHLPEYILTGVGDGNFWAAWGSRSQFAKKDRDVAGAHNGILQVTIYWGLAGLIALMALIFQAYRCLPKAGNNPMVLSVFGIAVSAVLFLQVHHVLSSKQFSLALGLVVGSKCWLWPRLAVKPKRPSINTGFGGNVAAPVESFQTAHRILRRATQ